jgi:formylglycine-generating enzyme required for sulfatase activity
MKKFNLFIAPLFTVSLVLFGSCGKEEVQTTNPVYHAPENGSPTIREITFVSIPGGTFRMGSDDGRSDEQPIHEVTVCAFVMSSCEITQGQYRELMGTNPSFRTGDDNLPVENVNWWDAIRFCNALSNKTEMNWCYNDSTGECDFLKNGYRLPTEAEWEYACRAGTTTKYYTGDSESDLARAGWYIGNNENRTHPVGRKTPNIWGLYDMHGNVWEWCHDVYSSTYYSSSPADNPIGENTGSTRSLRGGGWSNDASWCRSAVRYGLAPDFKYFTVGFRVVRHL